MKKMYQAFIVPTCLAFITVRVKLSNAWGGLGGGTAYAGSKGALDSFNLSLAKEVGAFGIRVNAVRPGLISTKIHNVHGGIAPMEQMAKNVVPIGRAGGPDEVAKAVVWLASDGASYVHGSILDVAGGR